MGLYEDIKSYVPFNEQEERDKEIFLHELETNPKVFTRESLLAHMTASAWIVNEDRSKVLLAHHNIYNAWTWLGGHADGEDDLLSVALREVLEESGVSFLRALSEDIFSIEVIPVKGHIKNGKYVPSHLHLNVTYLIEVSEKEELFIKFDENCGLGWFTFPEVLEKSNEEWFIENIYPKLNKKLLSMYGLEEDDQI